jgi:hypothetical protein
MLVSDGQQGIVRLSLHAAMTFSRTSCQTGALSCWAVQIVKAANLSGMRHEDELAAKRRSIDPAYIISEALSYLRLSSDASSHHALKQLEHAASYRYALFLGIRKKAERGLSRTGSMSSIRCVYLSPPARAGPPTHSALHISHAITATVIAETASRLH